jgi:iron complex transport system permease protein
VTRAALYASLLAALAVLAAASVLMGPAGLSSLIVIEIRVPRTALAVAVGASLGLSGAALQGLLRNPLAEPGLIGASPAASFGAALAFYFGLAAVSALAVPLLAMAGAAAAVVLLYVLAGRDASMLSLVLAGAALSPGL